MSDETMSYQVACFFQISDSAGLGKYVIGRGGSPTRFEVLRENVEQFIAEMGFSPDHASEPNDEIAESNSIEENEINEKAFKQFEGTSKSESVSQEEVIEEGLESKNTKVFISHGQNIDMVDQIKTMLDLADLEYEIAIDKESTAIPVPDKVLTAMRLCSAAVICVTAEEDMKREDGSYGINENVLIEIGAAFVLYKKKVVLVWDKRLEIPSNLQGLYRCEFEGDELSWSAGMKLMKAVNQFKKS